MAKVNQDRLNTCITISGTVLVLYDYFLTLPAEILEIWNSKFTGAKALYFVTRYSYIVYTLFLFALNFVTNPSETLSGYFLQSNGLEHPTSSRIIRYIHPANIRNLPKKQVFLLVGQILALILDVLVFGFTFAKTIHNTIEMWKVGFGNGLGYFILRDGTMYFLAKSIIGVLGTTLFFIPIPEQIDSWLGVIPSVANPLTLVLASRLFLNLRQVSRKQDACDRTLGTIDTIRDPVFATDSFLGNIGAPLRVGPDEEYEVEEIPTGFEPDIVEKRGIADENEITDDSRAPSNV
ncbi:hypothetical protein BD410DRAFT_650697 [Rickenella mellea]|uniref:DUF6533 domain-containing protein n=1 Tax=Rickenella mellea TaxID=50990 RepID=A0A4Y7PNQ1_9AGAM|nr:hypothetical protein BD410DRAFT_650697 [Rickenella mellea]